VKVNSRPSITNSLRFTTHSRTRTTPWDVRSPQPLPTATKNRDSSVGIAMGYGQDIFLYSSVQTGPALGPTKPPVQWVPGSLSPGAKRPGREAGHSPLPNAEIEYGGVIHHSLTRLHAVVLN
jgi:hypothetical protein